MNKFWMVHVEGTRGPTYKHVTLEAAKREAARLLAQSNVPGLVYILEAVEVGRLQTLHWETLIPDQLPF